MVGVKISEQRPNDFVYDPIFTVSSDKDFLKAQMKSRLTTMQFAICPIFPSMFSDLAQYPSQQFVVRQPTLPAIFKNITGIRRTVVSYGFPKNVDIEGRDRCKFFNRPKTPKIPPLALNSTRPCSCQSIESDESESRKKLCADMGIQTRYRESSAQTSPWQPDYKLMEDCDPEILKLDFLKWGSGLPPGEHEVQLIQRARMKRKWEEAMPPVIDEETLKKRQEIIKAIEINEWAFRDQEIQDIQDLRLELLEQMLIELHQKSKSRSEQKLEFYTKMKEAEKNEKISKLRHHAQRELRKLRMRKEGINKKFRYIDVVTEHADRKSELYGPQMRHGEHPKRWHQVIDDKMKVYKPRFIGVEDIPLTPDWLDEITKSKKNFSPKLPGTRLCIRETKWTIPVLKQWYEELKSLRIEKKTKCTLREKMEEKPETPLTPDVSGIDDDFEALFQAVIVLQKVLKGRASQILIFEGRDTCRELIRELRTTHGLRMEDKQAKQEQRLEVMSQQRDRKNCQIKIDTVQEDLARLAGGIIGTLLDFLNKALQKLLDERKAHALCLYIERERAKREAAEAGRRQKELRRMKEHDEIFKQVVKIHQETVDLYLQDILVEGMEFSSDDEAKYYIKKLADQIDDEAFNSQQSPNILDEEELIADLFHNFVLPDVEKKILREKMRKRQQTRLRSVHNEIYNRVDVLDFSKEESEMEPLPEDMLAQILEYLKEQEKEPVLEGEGVTVRAPVVADSWSQQHQILLENIASEVEQIPETVPVSIVEEPTTEELQEEVVDTSEIKEKAVDTSVTKEEAVDTPVIKEEAVDSPVIKEEAVDTPVIKEEAVDSPVIKEEAVDTPAVKEETSEQPAETEKPSTMSETEQ